MQAELAQAGARYASAAFAQRQLASDVANFVHDPLGFNHYAFEDSLRAWQAEELAALGEHLRNPATRYQPYLCAIASGHGIGKSGLAARLLNWAMSTFEATRAVVTAGTGKQLATKTWPEFDKWFRRSITADWWDVQAESITFKAERWRRQWRADRVTWSEADPQSFAGLHNLGHRIVVVFDEASTISDKIYEVTEGALTDERTEIIWLLLGQPEQLSGRFFDAFHRLRHRWRARSIDAREVEGTNKEQLNRQIEDHGEDSYIGRVRVRGLFPRQASNQLIDAALVAAARKRRLPDDVLRGLPLYLSLDVARFGEDESVLVARRGRRAWVVDHWNGLDTVASAERVITHHAKLKPDVLTVDGDGLGAGVVDTLAHRGYKVNEFHGAGSPNDERYLNKRAEVWGLMADWFKGEPQVSDLETLETDLTAPIYWYTTRTNKIQLESKDELKERGFASPNYGDALAMTFAVRVAARRPRVQPKAAGPWS